MKRLIVLLVLSFVLVAGSAVPAMAEDVQTCTQVTQYGGGVGIVCGVSHKPVDTGLADVNPVVLASFFFSMAGITLAKYRKLVRSEVGL